MPPPARKPVCVIGISGGSASGKSSLAHFLKKRLGSRAEIIRQDWYYRDHGRVGAKASLKLNFDHPDAIERDLFLSHLRTLLRGRPVLRPFYDYATHSRLKKTLELRPAPVLIIEGLFVLHERSVRDLTDFSVYIDVPDDVRLLRRVKRDCQERRIALAEMLRLYEFCVRPMHIRFIAPSAGKATDFWPQLQDRAFPRRLLRRIQQRLRQARRR